MQQRLPSSVLRALTAVAVVTFTAGVLLEQFALDFLQGHPYFVNLLSGATGFSTTALIAATLFNRAIVNQNARDREWAMSDAQRSWRLAIGPATRLLEPPQRAPLAAPPRPRSDMRAVHCDGLNEIIDECNTSGDLQRRALDRLPPLDGVPSELPFKHPDGEAEFLRIVRGLVDEQVPRLVQAFDIGDSHELPEVLDRLRSATDAGKAPAAAVGLCDFAALIQRHPHHAAYLRATVGRRNLASRWRELRERWRWQRRRRW